MRGIIESWKGGEKIEQKEKQEDVRKGNLGAYNQNHIRLGYFD